MIEKKSEYEITDLSSRLFWDTSINEVDWQKHKSFIVARVMEYGKLNDWRIIKTIYGLDTIKDLVLNLRNLDDFSIAFLSTILQVNKDQFRCYKLKQSQPSFWNY